FFIAQPFLVSGASMEPTFMPNEYLVIDKLYYHSHEPERGYVIIMRYPLDPSVYFEKRVNGIPGETVNITDGVITLISKVGTAHVLHEPYLVMQKNEV